MAVFISDRRKGGRAKGKVLEAMVYGLEMVALTTRQEVAELEILRFLLIVTGMHRKRN